MAVLLHAFTDLRDHFWGRLPYYSYKEHSGKDSHVLPLENNNHNSNNSSGEHFLEIEEENNNNNNNNSGKEEGSFSLLSSSALSNENNSNEKEKKKEELSVRIFTLNAGLIAITPHYKERMAGIIEYLNHSSTSDIICLQEICFQWIAIEIIKKTKKKFPYSYFFNFGIGFPLWPGCDGTGLLLLSKFLILETFFDKYHVNGYPWALHHCDYLGSKGISFARIQLPPQFAPPSSSSSSSYNGGGEPAIMTLYATHLHAEYNDNYQARANGSQDEYHAHRVAQGLQMAQFARLTAENDPYHLHVMCGDFNAPPSSPILALQGLAGFTDVMDEENAEPRATFGCKVNWFHTHGKTLPQRVDFILYRSYNNANIAPATTATTTVTTAAITTTTTAATATTTTEKQYFSPWRAIEAKTVCANIPNSAISLSDHNGVTATFLYDPHFGGSGRRSSVSGVNSNSTVYGSGGGRRGSVGSGSSSSLMRRKQPSKQHVPLLKQADEILQHGIDLAIRRRKRHRNRGLALWFVGFMLLLLTKRGQWSFGLAIVSFFFGLAELLICHFVIKDEIKVFQEKTAQVHLFLDTIR